MNEATVAQTIMTLFILAIFIGFLVWSIRSKQFHDVEDAKYRMLEDEKTGTENKADTCGEKQP
ncbi:MAG: cbb3-type cytochrome oxidase assembly protein [Dehalococcoidales bacterium]|jgi:cbb3-type cytochrome oxidase maturation protein